MGITREGRASESLCLTHRVGITSQGASFHLLSCTDQSSSQRTLPVTLLSAKGNAMTTGCLSGHTPAPHPEARDAAAPGPLRMCWLVTVSRAGRPPGWAPQLLQGSPALPVYSSAAQLSTAGFKLHLRRHVANSLVELTFPFPSCLHFRPLPHLTGL